MLKDICDKGRARKLKEIMFYVTFFYINNNKSFCIGVNLKHR